MKFLNLSYYKTANIDFPLELTPKHVTVNNIGLEYIRTELLKLAESDYGKQLIDTLYKKTDLVILNDTVARHGIHYKHFMSDILKERVNSLFSQKEQISVQLLTSHNIFYNNQLEKRRDNLRIICSDYLNMLIEHIDNDSIYIKLQLWVVANSEEKLCEICKNKFKPINLPHWVYYPSHGHTSICYECPVRKDPSLDEMKYLIKELVEVCNFIPNANFHPLSKSFSERIDSSIWSKVCDIILQMGVIGNDSLNSNTIFKRMFGSWFKALAESDVLPEGVLNTGRGVRCIAKSGNECNSLDEMFIDNWMFERDIVANKEPLYPKHPIFNQYGKRRADWYFKGYFIEYFGLKGEEHYDKKTIEKIKLSEELNLNLISIFPSDLKDLSNKLSIILT